MERLTVSSRTKLAGAGAAVVLLLFLWPLAGRGTSAAARTEGPGPTSPPAVLQPPPLDLESAAVPAERRAPVASQPAAAPSLASAAPSATEGSLRVRVSWFDGSPAEAIGVLVQPNWRSGVSPLRTREYSTDAAGEVRVEGLPPGDALVELTSGDVNASEIVEIAPGAEVEVELTPARGFDVTGVVRDPSGAPVAGAEIWGTSDNELTRGFVLTRTDAEGRFALRSLAHSCPGARARGFAPSLCKSMLAGAGAALEVELVLMGPGGAVTGTVVDPAGRPLARAWVAIGLDHPLGYVQMVPVGGSQQVKGLLPGEIEARTDAEGRYRIDGLAPGVRRMAVRAQGFAAWRGEVEVVEQRTRSQDVRVQPGVTLVGRLTKPDGTAARGTVEVEDDVEMLRTEAFTDAEGRFCLAGLEVGELEVRATGRRRAGRAQVTLRGAPGETLTWDVCLSMGGAIRGRVLDASGAPLARWEVHGYDDPFVSEDHDYAQAVTDAEGRFVLQDMHARSHRVEVSPPEHYRFPVATAKGILPEREELVLRIEPVQLPSVRFVGRVVDALGQPVDDAHIALGKKAGSGSLFYPEPSGAFDIGPIPPGAWALTVSSPALVDCPRLVLGPLQPGLRAEIRVEAPAAGERAQLMLRITRGDELVLEDQIRPREDAEGHVHPGDYGAEASLAPGRYRVEAWFEDGPQAAADLQVDAGEPTTLRLDL